MKEIIYFNNVKLSSGWPRWEFLLCFLRGPKGEEGLKTHVAVTDQHHGIVCHSEMAVHTLPVTCL